jgi:hypothetical protein
MRPANAAKPAGALTPNRLLNADLQDSDNAPPDKVSERRRQRSTEAWHCLRGAIARQHRTVAVSDPHSPRIKPTLALRVDRGDLISEREP